MGQRLIGLAQVTSETGPTALADLRRATCIETVLVKECRNLKGTSQWLKLPLIAARIPTALVPSLPEKSIAARLARTPPREAACTTVARARIPSARALKRLSSLSLYDDACQLDWQVPLSVSALRLTCTVFPVDS
jgi:hypothetical protein